jgi:ectoine hydroxylase-related dioxygenase (phytanoyl-CoA dioxygenase family)
MTARADAFQRDGAVCLRNAISPTLIALLRDGIDQNIDRPSPRAKVASNPSDPGRFIEDFCNWREIDAYQDFVLQCGLAEIAAELMGSSTARFYHDHMLTKEAGATQPTPWHQDQPFYNVDGRQNCSFWIPVDPVNELSSLRFAAGSHTGPWFMPRSFLDSKANWFPEGSLQELPDIDARPDLHPVLAWALEPGDVVCFHMLTLHSARGADRQRRVFSIRFLGDDATHAPRPWPTSPQFPDLTAELDAGAPMDHPLFPVLWPKSEVEPSF